MRHTYLIDGKKFTVNIQSQNCFFRGRNEILSQRFGDLAKNKPWYSDGYAVIETEAFFDSGYVKTEIEKTVKKIITDVNPRLNLDDFSLGTYHKYVTNDEHNKVIGKTRRLFPSDLGFDSQEIVSALASYMGCDLCYQNSVSNSEQWIIVRINRPNSVGYNPVHKDVYELFDTFNSIPKMINVWIPVCGVDRLTGLPLAPGSHIIPESKIERSKAGSTLNGQKYSVNCILRWDNSCSLETVSPNETEMIIFSSHLIHGLAVNNNPDTTRVSLEFRLYERVDAG